MAPDKFREHIKITMIGLYEDDGRYIKFLKLNKLIDLLKEQEIHIDNEVAKNYL